MTEHLLFPDISLCLALGLGLGPGTEDNRDGSFREAGVPGGKCPTFVRSRGKGPVWDLGDEISQTPAILTYNDGTVTHLHIKWGVALGPIVVGVGTRHLPPTWIHAPVTNPR